MSENLDKALRALEAAKELTTDVSQDELVKNVGLHRQFLHLIDLASVQAGVAQAAALERIANVLEKRPIVVNKSE